MSEIHGSSPFIQGGDRLFATADFMDFAPCPCICLKPCASKLAQSRQYARVYDNHLEVNLPCAPFACFTCSENCIADNVSVSYFDRLPTRSGMCCGCLPFTCCGPPVIFASKPMCCCCIDLTPCYGETLSSAPCNLFGLKSMICCGDKCYLCCAMPILYGMSNSKDFLGKFKSAVDEYKARQGLPEEEVAIFEFAQNSNCPCMDKSEKIERN